MLIIEKPDTNDFICPICHTRKDEPVAMIKIDNTDEKVEIHLSCIDLSLYYCLPDSIVLYQRIKTIR